MSYVFRTHYPHECARCREPIELSDDAIDREYATEFQRTSSIYHAECLVDVDPYYASYALNPVHALPATLMSNPPKDLRWMHLTRKEGVDREKRDALRDRADALVARGNEVSIAERARRRRKVSEPVARRDTSEMSRDRKGRPRVSLMTSLIGREHALATAEQPGKLDAQLLSPLREYVLLEMEKHPPIDFPWQPCVGTLCIAWAETKVTRRAIERFLQWKSLDQPTPVLCIVGGDPAQRDATERALRALLDEAGYVGDQAATAHVTALHRAHCGPLFATLDEAISIEGPSVSAKVSEDPRTRALALLVEATDEDRKDAYAGALSLLIKQWRGMSDAMKEEAAQRAARCLSHEPAQKAALQLLATLPPARDPAPLRAAWIELLRASRSVSKAATATQALLARAKDDTRFQALLELVMAEPKATARGEAWLWLLTNCVDRAVAERLNPWAETLPESDPRKKIALEIAAQIAASAPDPKPSKARPKR